MPIPDTTTEASRQFTYAQHSDNTNVGGSNVSFKNPYAYAMNYLNQTAYKTTKECLSMRNNFEWYAKWAAAQGVVKGVDLLSKSASAGYTLGQNLSEKHILYTVAATSGGRMVTGNWPIIQKAFDCANVASSAFAVYKKCDSLKAGHPTGVAGALAGALRSSLGITIPSAMWPLYDKFDLLPQGRSTMFMAASWVGSHLLQNTPLIKHLANHPLANNILWGMRLGSTAYLASPLVATVRAWNAKVVQMRLAASVAPKTAIKAAAPTSPAEIELQQNLIDFRDKAENLKFIDADKKCLPASAVQAFAQMGLARSRFTQPSELPMLEAIRELTQKYTDQLDQKAVQVRDTYYETCEAVDACQAVLDSTSKSGAQIPPEQTEDFLTAITARNSTAIAWDEAEIAIISNNTQILSSANKDKFATDLSEINACMLRSKIYGRFAELLNDRSPDFQREMALFRSNHQDLLKETLLSITTQGLSGHAYVSMQMRIEDLTTGAPTDPISDGERRDWLAIARNQSDNNLKQSQLAWDKIAVATKGSPLPLPAALPINERIKQEAAAKAKAEKALVARSAKDLALLQRIDPEDHSNRLQTPDRYPAVFVKVDENGQTFIGQSLAGGGGTWSSRKFMRGDDVELEIRTVLADQADAEAIRCSNDEQEVVLYAKLPSTFRGDLGLKDLTKQHNGEELTTDIDGYSEKIIYKRPSDKYGIGKNSDHELTAAVLLAQGLEVQNELVTKFGAGTLFAEPLEKIEEMIGFLDLCQNHRVTRLQSGLVPSFLDDVAWQNHWAGFSLNRDKIRTQLARCYAIAETQARVNAKNPEDSVFVEPRAGIAKMQEDVLLHAMERLGKLVNRTQSPVNCESDGNMLRNAFITDFTDLKAAVGKAMEKRTDGQNLFDKCREPMNDTRRPTIENNMYRKLPVLEMLYEASGSMMYALENPNIQPVIEATLRDVDPNKSKKEIAQKLKEELNACFAEINKAYKDYVRYAGYNEDLLTASDESMFAVESGKNAEINARLYCNQNYFESPEIPTTLSEAVNKAASRAKAAEEEVRSFLSSALIKAKSTMSRGKQAAQAGAGMLASGATAGATVAYAGASAMFGAPLRLVGGAAGHAPVDTDDDAPPPAYAPSSGFIALPPSTPVAGAAPSAPVAPIVVAPPLVAPAAPIVVVLPVAQTPPTVSGSPKNNLTVFKTVRGTACHMNENGEVDNRPLPPPPQRVRLVQESPRLMPAPAQVEQLLSRPDPLVVLESVPVPEVPSPREAQSPTYPALQQSPRDFSALSDGDLDDVPLAQLSADQSLQATP